MITLDTLVVHAVALGAAIIADDVTTGGQRVTGSLLVSIVAR